MREYETNIIFDTVIKMKKLSEQYRERSPADYAHFNVSSHDYIHSTECRVNMKIDMYIFVLQFFYKSHR